MVIFIISDNTEINIKGKAITVSMSEALLSHMRRRHAGVFMDKRSEEAIYARYVNPIRANVGTADIANDMMHILMAKAFFVDTTFDGSNKQYYIFAQQLCIFYAVVISNFLQNKPTSVKSGYFRQLGLKDEAIINL